jgi:hypothetical protein
MLMSELQRMVCKSEKGDLTLVLTRTHLLLEPSPEFRRNVEESLDQARNAAEKAPALVGWLVDKVASFAENQVEKFFQPHPLTQVELLLRKHELELTVGISNIRLTNLKADPMEALVFSTRFHEAKAALRQG